MTNIKILGDTKIGELELTENNWECSAMSKYHIWFNAKIIAVAKTKKWALSKFDKLAKKHNLK